MTKGTFLITGASDGIGAVYADRLARRGHDLILVARRAERLEALAATLTAETGVKIETLGADLARPEDLARIERRLREDAAITGLVNNAGIAGETTFAGSDPAYLTGMIDLNVLAVTRLAAAIAPRLAELGSGTIVNMTSVTALMPDGFTAVYPATKAYVLSFTEALHQEFKGSGIKVSALCPGPTRTEFFDVAGMAGARLRAFSAQSEDVVAAGLAGLARNRAVIVPGFANRLTAQSSRFLPRALMRRIVAAMKLQGGPPPGK